MCIRDRIRSGELVDYETKTNINYIEIPILLKVKYGHKDRTNFFFTLGPSIGYAFSSNYISKRTGTADGLVFKTSKDFIKNNSRTYKRFDTSASLGVGVNYPFGPGKFFAETRYLFGITNLIKGGRLGNPDNLRNRGIGLSTGYLVSIGKNKNSKI